MISLALRKLPAITEDVVTAAVFDLLRWRLVPALMGELLMLARPAVQIGGATTSPAFAWPVFDDYEVELWPVMAGEPDVRIVLRSGETTVAHVLIEAKLGANKSGTGEITEDRHGGDQPARYLVAESEANAGLPVFLVYLTHHAAAPRDDLAESILRLMEVGRGDLAERLLWASWRDVEALFARSAPGTPAFDVARLLREVAMFRFAGFAGPPLPALVDADFYQESLQRAEGGYFLHGALDIVGGPRFYAQVSGGRRTRIAVDSALGSMVSPAFYTQPAPGYGWPGPLRIDGPSHFYSAMEARR